MNMSANEPYVTKKELIIAVILPIIALATIYFMPFFNGLSKFIWAVVGLDILVVLGSLGTGAIKNKDFRYTVFSFQQKVLASLMGTLLVMNLKIGVSKEVIGASMFVFFFINVVVSLPGVLLFSQRQDAKNGRDK
ncbi:hypothetical protein [Bacillus sp. NPDC094106]|uniref:hypothetical protein n=1 Tax=Bacillus sp. NPDC094106 TaxID=3363949 RepID=UPI0037F457BB